jgi:hypothetical protein
MARCRHSLDARRGLVIFRAPCQCGRPLVWLSILILATLYGPFLPQAYSISTALAAPLLVASTPASARTLGLAAPGSSD